MIAATSSCRLVVAVCSVVCLLGAARLAAAQGMPVASRAETPGRVSVFATGGYNTQSDDESNLGRGVGLSGGVGYRIGRGLWVEGVVSRFEHRRNLMYYAVTYDATGMPLATPYPATLKGSATYAMGQARYVFSSSRVQPYVTGGIGLMHYSGNGWASVFPPQPGQPAASVPGVTVNAVALGTSGGVEVALARRASVGPYVGLLLSNTRETGTKYLLHGGVRITLGW